MAIDILGLLSYTEFSKSKTKTYINNPTNNNALCDPKGCESGQSMPKAASAI